MILLILFCAKYLLFVSAVITIAAFLYADGMIKRKVIWLGLIASVIAFIFAKVSAHYIYDTRPFVMNNIQPLIQHIADNGFPSDHTLVASLAAFIVFIFNKKVGLILMISAVLIGVARVLAQIHHPLDIVGSILIALISVVLAQYVLEIRYFRSLLNQSTK